jgi:hypothetical protein
MALKSK